MTLRNFSQKDFPLSVTRTHFFFSFMFFPHFWVSISGLGPGRGDGLIPDFGRILRFLNCFCIFWDAVRLPGEIFG